MAESKHNRNGVSRKQKKPQKVSKVEQKRRELTEELDSVYNDCQALILNSANTRHMISATISARGAELDMSQIAPLAKALSEDLGGLQNRLQSLYTEAQGKIASLKGDLDELEIAGFLGNSFSNWQDDFGLSVAQHILKLQSLCGVE